MAVCFDGASFRGDRRRSRQAGGGVRRLARRTASPHPRDAIGSGMLYHKQKRPYHNHKEGKPGDCLSTCFACILHLNREDVPEIETILLNADSKGKPENTNIVLLSNTVNKWLKPLHQVWCIPIFTKSVKRALSYMGTMNPTGRYILCGAGITENYNHAVCCIGDCIEHNPSPNPESGLTGALYPDQTFFIAFIIGIRL